MRPGIASRKRQRGAVAIVVGLTIAALIGFLGIVIDLGHLYVRKTELQNAADAAALAGARQLDGTAAGIGAAAAAAIATAAANASDLGQTPVAIGNEQIRFGPTSGGGWSDVATAQGSPATMTFIKVDTAGIAQGTRSTWFMPVLNPAQASTTTNGVAVAGAPVCDGLPIFVCPPAGGGPFIQGQSYHFLEDPSVVGYFDPSPPGSPSLIPPGVHEMSDIICAGKMSCIGAGTYSSRTQAGFGRMASAFNTRFGDFKGSFKDSAAACRPDTNVKPYPFAAATWMESPPTSQDGVNGLHWSAFRPPALPGVPAVNGSYPSAASGGGTPYSQTTPAFYSPPTGYEDFEQAGRRIITVAIADPAVCNNGIIIVPPNTDFPIAGFGRFFMQIPYQGTGPGSGKGLYVEYLDTIQQLKASAPDLKLYR